MAEQDGGVATAAAGTDAEETQDQASAQGLEQPQVYTPEELRENFRGVIREENAAFWNEMRTTVAPMQKQLAELAPKLEALLPQIAEVQGDAKATRRLVKDVLAGKSLDNDQLQAINEAERLEDQQRADVRRQREETQRQKEREEAEKGRITPQQVRDYAFGSAWELSKQRTERFAKRQGYKGWADIQDTVMAIQRPAGSDERPDFGLPDWEDKAEQAILTKAAARDAEGNATVNVPSLRGGGGQSAADIVAAFGREENPIPWSPKVAAAMKELGLSI